MDEADDDDDDDEDEATCCATKAWIQATSFSITCERVGRDSRSFKSGCCGGNDVVRLVVFVDGVSA
jgi:hypothetical protein